MTLDDAERDAFFRLVWDFVRQVPVGRVVSYGQVAQALSPPLGLGPDEYRREGARLVGNAMAASPEGVPWHRVVNAQGRLSGAPATRQQRLLQAEGVAFFDGRLDMASARWTGDGEPARQGSLF